MVLYYQICVLYLLVLCHLVGGTYGLVCIHYLYLCLGGLDETTVMECGFNFILPLVLKTGSIVGKGMLCATICPFTDRKYLPVTLKPVAMQYDLCITAPIM